MTAARTPEGEAVDEGVGPVLGPVDGGGSSGNGRHQPFAPRSRRNEAWNTIVHDAAIQIVQIDRLIRRLNWMLSTALDTLLFHFVHNPTVSLTDLHEINKLNFAKWKQRLKEKVLVPLAVR